MPQGIDEDYNGQVDAVEGGAPGPDMAKLKALFMQLAEMLGIATPAPEPAPAPANLGDMPASDAEGLPGEASAPDKAKQLEAFRSKLKGGAPPVR